jgi:excisionase family DNA binding protein
MSKQQEAEPTRKYARPSDRGLGPNGGGWSIHQAAAWSGIGEHYLRKMATDDKFPNLKIGRRVLIPREAFIRWFNELAGRKAV